MLMKIMLIETMFIKIMLIEIMLTEIMLIEIMLIKIMLIKIIFDRTGVLNMLSTPLAGDRTGVRSVAGSDFIYNVRALTPFVSGIGFYLHKDFGVADVGILSTQIMSARA